jgi:ABC-type polysaccharide/polyol phosphate export permease
MIKELFLHRKFIYQNAISNFRYQYSGSIIGVFWNFINPIIESFLYILIFSFLLQLRGSGNGDHYGLFLITGLFPWFVFTELVINGTNAYYKNRNLLGSLKIPLKIPLAIEFVSAYIKSIIYFVLLALINLFYGSTPSLVWMLWPVISIFLLLFGYGLAMILGIFRVFFADISEVIRHLLHMWRWTMPIIYTAEVFPEEFQSYLRLNPPYTFIEVLRKIFLDNALPTSDQFFIMLFWLVTILFISEILHSKFEAEVRDNL